jgi:hypothetical protein
LVLHQKLRPQSRGKRCRCRAAGYAVGLEEEEGRSHLLGSLCPAPLMAAQRGYGGLALQVGEQATLPHCRDKEQRTHRSNTSKG